MPSQNKLIKEGIKYSDALFKEIAKRLGNGIRQCDTLEEFLDLYNRVFPEKGNPLLSVGYDKTLVRLILAETNNHKFSRPGQKEMARTVIENIVGNHIAGIGEDLRVRIRDVVKDGYDNQLPQEQIAENITAAVETINNTRARATARTEIARTATVSDYIINVERGAEFFKVDCRGTCCPICEETYHWGDEEYSIDQTDMLPPLHPNCRCVAFFYTKDNEPTDLKNESLIRKEINELKESDIPNAEERIQYFKNQL
jgi:hypothetical protein